jgi:hypothetical protein
LWEDLSDVDSIRDKLHIRMCEIRQMITHYWNPMFRLMLKEKGHLDEIDVEGETLYLKGVYENPKGAVQMAKWRSDDGHMTAILVEECGLRFIVYSTD